MLIEKLLSGAARKIDAALEIPGALSEDDRWKLIEARDRVNAVRDALAAMRAEIQSPPARVEGDPKF